MTEFKTTKEAMELAQRNRLPAGIPVDIERSRLERLVIEAAKEYKRYFFPLDAAKDILPDSPGNRFLLAVEALINYEARLE